MENLSNFKRSLSFRKKKKTIQFSKLPTGDICDIGQTFERIQTNNDIIVGRFADQDALIEELVKRINIMESKITCKCTVSQNAQMNENSTTNSTNMENLYSELNTSNIGQMISTNSDSSSATLTKISLHLTLLVLISATLIETSLHLTLLDLKSAKLIETSQYRTWVVQNPF